MYLFLLALRTEDSERNHYSLKSTPEYFKENVINLLTLTCSCYNILCKKYIYNYQLNKIDETFKRKKIIHDVYYTDNCLNFIKDK
jgi:hypothetical protein